MKVISYGYQTSVLAIVMAGKIASSEQQRQDEQRRFKTKIAAQSQMSTSSLPSLEWRSGRLSLNASCGEQYFTRYRIDHLEQSRGLCRYVMFEECAPCINFEQQWSLLGWLWSCVRSEVFICILHLTSLTLGALKESEYLQSIIKYDASFTSNYCEACNV